MADEVAGRERRDELTRAERRADLQAVLSTPEGRRVLERLVFEFGALQEQTYHPDPHQRAFHDGQRAVGITLDRELYLTAQDGWARMHAERLERLRLVAIDPNPSKSDQ